MNAQVSNRQALLEGALQCMGERDYAHVTTREIAAAAEANVASIAYHFGSKDALVAEALAEGFRRWLTEFMVEAGRASDVHPKARLRAALATLGERLERQRGLAYAFISALSHATHHEKLKNDLRGSFEEMRAGLSAFLELDGDGYGRVRASLLIALFDGLLIQWLIDPERREEDIEQLSQLLDTLPDAVFADAERRSG